MSPFSTPSSTPSLHPTLGEKGVCLAAISGVHGIRGQVRLKIFLEDPFGLLDFETVDQDGRPLLITRIVRVEEGSVIAEVNGVTDRTTAEGLKGRQLWISRDVLPTTEDDTYYHADLIGLQVVDGNSQNVGRVNALYDFGAGDILEITFEDGTSEMFPFTHEVFPTIDLAARQVTFLRPQEVVVEKESSQ